MHNASNTARNPDGEGRSFVWATACLICCAAAAALFFFGVTPTRLARAPALTATDTQSATYIRQRPFDAVGFLAFFDSVAALGPATTVSGEPALVAALKLAPAEPGVLKAAVRHELTVGSKARGLELAASLASASPADQRAAFELLRGQVGAAEWSTFFARKLDERWPLSDSFLLHVCATDVSSQLAVSHHLAWEIGKRAGVSPQALLCVERRLIEAGQITSAYRLRLGVSRNLGRRVDHVYNSGFESAPSGSAFDWTINAGGEYRDGFVATIRNGVEFGNLSNILQVRFTGQPIRGPVSTQTLALAPGRYRLSYRERSAGLAGSKPPMWTVRCLPSPDLLTAEPWETGEATLDWTTRTTLFSVPDRCAGQSLRLEAQTRLSAMEGLRGTLATDDVVISAETIR